MRKEYDSKKFMKTLSFVLVIAIITIFTISAVLLLFSNSSKDTEAINFYFVNIQTNEWLTELREIEKTDSDKMAVNVLNELISGPTSAGLSKSIPETVAISSIAISKDNTLEVHFSKEYEDLSFADELACRTSLVLTLTELSFIDNVRLYVEDAEIMRANGLPLGLLDKDSFVIDIKDPAVTKILTLYFSDPDVLGLLPEQREIEVSPNKQLPAEQYILQELIKGPSDPGHYALIPQDTKVLSVTVDKYICYIDFSAEFINKFHGGSSAESMMIYSIVNSLTELQKVQKVQFLIEGNKYSNDSTTFSVDLTTPFERQEDLIIGE